MSTGQFQDLVCKFQEVIDTDMGIMDETGLILACTDESRIGTTYTLVELVAHTKELFIKLEGGTYKKVYIKSTLKYIIFIQSNDPNNEKFLSLFEINLINLKAYYDEKFDRHSFIQNVLSGTISHGDVVLKAKELHIPYSTYRVVYLIKTPCSRENHACDIIQELFPNKSRDFVVAIDDENIVLVKELKAKADAAEIEKIAWTVVDTLNTELMIKALVGIGTPVDNMTDIRHSLEEAKIALAVGVIFEKDKFVVSYNSLGVGRLIYQLSPELCRLFLNEIFKGNSLEALDSETTMTIQKFFENNLNISEASRQLYVHRNTLVYRLDKIQRLTGLDLRNFDDAITFKVATLVKTYLDGIN